MGFRPEIMTEPANASRNTTPGDASGRQPSLPTVRLPHKFEHDGTAIWDSSQQRCSHNCGEPWLYFRDRRRYLVDDLRSGPMPECVYCQIVHLAMQKLEIQSGLVETDGFHLGFTSIDSGSNLATDGDSVTWWRLFSPSDSGTTLSFNPYDVPGCRWTDANALCNDSIKFAETCIKNCLGSHEQCRSNVDDTFLPTRMVCVDAFHTGLDVRLDDKFSDASDTRYIALSYCWGDHHPVCKTTTSNLEDQMERIRWADLPSTFQDAVGFTRNLGIRYLWIDSRCIIQQEAGKFSQLAKDDWTKESMTMFGVYKNSYATLAALCGLDSRAGLRKVSNRSEAIPLAHLRFDRILNRATEEGESSTFPIYIQPSHPIDDKVHGYAILESQRGRYSLLGRAWCYQERMVSPRVLCFTDSEIIYQCFEDGKCECGATTRYRWRPKSNRKWESTMFQTKNTGDGAMAFDEIETIEQGWRDVVVTSYSPLHLSFGSDRLPALAAVAQQFQALRPNERYMAGLWSGNLWLELLWYCRRNLGGLEEKLILNRPYSLPTWSWASLPCQVSYESVNEYFETAVVEIVEARCAYLQSPGFGTLESSVLMVRSWTLPSRVERKDGWNVDFWYLKDGDWMKYVPKVGGDLTFFEDCDDTGYQTFHRGEELCLLEVSRGKRTGKRGFLLLRCQDNENSIYTRAGVVWHQGHRRSPVEIDQQAGYFDILFEREKVMKQCEIR